MQSLNLSGEAKKSDGRLKSLLWPTVENAWDVDYLGQQGFWICLIIAIISIVTIAITVSDLHNPTARTVTLAFGALVCFVYLVGGVGVRQASWPAALLVFILYVLDHLVAGTIGVLTIIIGAVLLSNVRATLLASKWKPATEDEDRPMRFNETLRDKLVDQLPPRAWPILKYPFYSLAAIVLLLMIASSAITLSHRSSRRVTDENATPSVVVSPEDSH